MRSSFAFVAAAIAALAASSSAFASGKIFYGSRAGMTVTVVSVSGVGTANAVIRTRHTRADAKAFCLEYAQDKSEACVRKEMETPLNDAISGNCNSGVFTDFGGGRHRFEGKVRRPSDDMMAKYVIRDLSNNDVADGSSASGYPTLMQIFRALCPNRAPSESEE
jgi:hypothetical protein